MLDLENSGTFTWHRSEQHNLCCTLVQLNEHTWKHIHKDHLERKLSRLEKRLLQMKEMGFI